MLKKTEVKSIFILLQLSVSHADYEISDKLYCQWVSCLCENLTIRDKKPN